MEIEQLYSRFLQCEGITTDTRNCVPGFMFFALKGERFNGNEYVAQALEKGCLYAVTDEPWRFDGTDSRILPVNSVLAALQQMALFHRHRLNVPVIGITGTNGKTTTKELVTAVLSKRYNVLATKGNLNNSIGVPLTVLGLKPEHQLAVIEMGASHPGDIAELTAVCDPDFGIITNVGMAHLQGFGSYQGVLNTKGELYGHLRGKNGVVFLNRSLGYLVEMAAGMNSIEYGHGDAGFVNGRVLDCNPMLRFVWNRKDGVPHTVQMRMTGAYNVDNALAAVAAGLYFNVPEDDISEALASYIPDNNRSQIIDTANNRLVVDAYNANPTSMGAALDNFKAMDSDCRMLILGDMRELGEYSAGQHRMILQRLESEGYDNVVLVGPEFRKAAIGDIPSGWHFFENSDVLARWLQDNRPEGMTILVKGSNSIRLTGIIEFL